MIPCVVLGVFFCVLTCDKIIDMNIFRVELMGPETTWTINLASSTEFRNAISIFGKIGKSLVNKKMPCFSGKKISPRFTKSGDRIAVQEKKIRSLNRGGGGVGVQSRTL